MSHIFAVAALGLLIFMSVLEVVRYRAAQRGADELPYPRRRLIRRLLISLIFAAILSTAFWWPEGRMAQLVLILVMLLALLLGLALLWRELRETSLAALEQTRSYDRAAAERIARIVEEERLKQERDSSGQGGQG